MGWVRKIGPIAAVVVVAGFATVAKAEEPLIVTTLADAETHLLAPDGSLVNPSAEQRNANFINALGAATAAREQAIDAQCRTMTAVPASGEARMTWEAKCRYRRR